MSNPSSEAALSHQDLREMCMVHAGAHETFPFGLETMVFKVGVSEYGTPFKGKVFALLALESDPPQLSLKCNPARALELRADYPAITGGYHLSKKHWNTLTVDQTLSRELVLELIEHSHALVAAGLTRLERVKLGL
jgi:predicted DNA-binding protein (MmcQ/YjbR family)